MSKRRIFHDLLTALNQRVCQDNPLPQPGLSVIQHTILRDCSGALASLLSPPHRLVHSPLMMAPPLLQPFVEGTRRVMLLYTQNGKTLPATLHAVRDTYLIADTQYSVFRRRTGDTVLVIFPVAPQQHYVVQTSVQKVYAFRLELAYRDPRYDIRHALPLGISVTLHPVPARLLTALVQQQGQIVRQITLTRQSPQGIASSTITDLFCPAGSAEPADAYTTAAPILNGTLRDISLGGSCLTLEATNALDALPYRLVRLTIPLPSVSRCIPEWTALSLTLRLLGIVRSISPIPSTVALHIRFLNRLLPELDALLWQLEGGGLERPLPPSPGAAGRR